VPLDALDGMPMENVAAPGQSVKIHRQNRTLGGLNCDVLQVIDFVCPGRSIGVLTPGRDAIKRLVACTGFLTEVLALGHRRGEPADFQRAELNREGNGLTQRNRVGPFSWSGFPTAYSTS